MGVEVMGRAMLIVGCDLSSGPDRVAITDGHHVEIIERTDAGDVRTAVPLDRVRFRDRGEIVILSARRHGKSDRVAAMGKALARMERPMADLGDDRSWVRMNARHQHRAGLRSQAIPRVICPA